MRKLTGGTMLTAQADVMSGRKKRDDLAIKAESDVVRMARIVSSFEDRPMVEIISEILRPALQRLMDKHIKAEADRKLSK